MYKNSKENSYVYSQGFSFKENVEISQLHKENLQLKQDIIILKWETCILLQEYRIS